MTTEYWRICIEEAFGAAGIDATDAQIGVVAEIVEGGHTQAGMHTGPVSEPTVDPRDQQIRDLKDELEVHRPIRTCLACQGKDLIDVRACGACNGTGYLYGIR